MSHKLGDRAVGKAFNKLSQVVPDGLAVPYPSFDLFWALFRAR